MSEEEKLYGIKDTFDLVVYKEGKETFTIDTAKCVSIFSGNNEAIFKVEDASFRVKLLGDILNGYYKDIPLEVVGESTAKSYDTFNDHSLKLHIKEAYIESVKIVADVENICNPVIRFRVPTLSEKEDTKYQDNLICLRVNEKPKLEKWDI